MEEERHASSGVPDETSEPRLKDRFTETVARLFRGSEAEDDTQEDDQDKKTRRRKGKSARWRKFLRGVFSRSTEEDLSEQRKRRSGSFMPFISLEPVAKPNQELGDEGEKKQEKLKEAKEPENNTEAISDTDARQTSAESQPEVQQLSEVSLPTQEAAVVTDAEQGILHIIHDHEQAPPSESKTLSQPIQTEQSERSSVDAGARGLAVGLTGMEYLGRKRADRKLAKNQQQQAETINKTTQKLEQQVADLNKVNEKQTEQDLRYKSAVQSEALKAKRGIDTVPAAPVAPKRQPVELKPEEKPSRPTTERIESPLRDTNPESKQNDIQAERSPEKARQETAKLARIEKELEERKRQLEKESEYNQQIYENAEKAAAHGVPVEKYYERRHEVKDDKTAFNPVSVGSIIRDRQPVRQTATAEPSVPLNMRDRPISSGFASNLSQADQQMYMQAAKSGFYTAVTILAVLIVITVLR